MREATTTADDGAREALARTLPPDDIVQRGLTEEEAGTALGIFLKFRNAGFDETRAFLSALRFVASWIAKGELEALAARPAAAGGEESRGMLYWDARDQENGYHDLDELAFMVSDHHDAPHFVFKLQRAELLPDVWAAVLPDPQDEDCIVVRQYATEEEAKAAVASSKIVAADGQGPTHV